MNVKYAPLGHSGSRNPRNIHSTSWLRYTIVIFCIIICFLFFEIFFQDSLSPDDEYIVDTQQILSNPHDSNNNLNQKVPNPTPTNFIINPPAPGASIDTPSSTPSENNLPIETNVLTQIDPSIKPDDNSSTELGETSDKVADETTDLDSIKENPLNKLTIKTVFASYQTRLNPNTKYFAYIPDVGGTSNQFRSLLNAINVGSHLNRTIIIPPIMPTMHVPGWHGPRYSLFYDLEYFSQQTGISLLEWKDLKPDVPSNIPDEFKVGFRWLRLSEPLDCYKTSNRDFTKPSKFHRHFFLDPMRETNTTHEYRGSQISPFDSTNGKANTLSSHIKTFTTPFHTSQQFICVTDVYSMWSEEKSKLSWGGYGPYLKFSKALDDAVDIILNELVPSQFRLYPFKDIGDDFIIFHIRRNDVAGKCKYSIGVAPKGRTNSIEYQVWYAKFLQSRCHVSTQDAYEALKEWVDKNPETRAGLPIIIATDERRKKELQELSNPPKDWITTLMPDGSIKTHFVTLINHKFLRTATRFHKVTNNDSPAIGGYWVPMIDANLLTRGRYLIGSQPSAMSQMAAKRRHAWRQGAQFVLVPKKWERRRHLKL